MFSRSMSVCLNIPNFTFALIDYDFPKYDVDFDHETHASDLGPSDASG